MWITILEIFLFMAVAALLGMLLGWVLRGTVGSEQAELAQARLQLRAMKKAQREQQAQSKAAEVSAIPVVSAKPSDDQPPKGAADKKDSESVKAVSATKAPAKKKAPVAKNSATTTKAKPAKAKVKAPRKTQAQREADQEAGRKAFVEIAARVGKADSEDKLTRIYGVGKRYEGMLKELGLSSFEQLSKLKKADLKVLSAALGVLDDRINEEDWAGSAKTLFKQSAT